MGGGFHKKAFTATSSKLTDYIISANRQKASSVLKGSSFPINGGGGNMKNGGGPISLSSNISPHANAGGYNIGSQSIVI